MCGHFGFIFKNKNGMFPSQAKAFAEGLYIDALRGEDGTGICAIDKDGSAVVVKDSIEASWFLQNREVKDVLDDAGKSGKALLGHNRKATIGSTKSENSHPFIVEDDFVFFHNGSLYNWQSLGFKTEVDSEALGKHIHKSIREESPLGEALGKVSGAYAVVWYDLLKEEVCIIRNMQRPMFIVECDSGWFYGSELEMIRLVCARNNQRIVGEAELPVDTLVKWDLTKDGADIKPIITKLDVKKPIPTSTKAKAGGTTKAGRRGTTTAGINKSAFKRWLKNDCKGEPCSFWVEDVDPVRGLTGGPTCELTGTIDIMMEDGTQFEVKCSAYVSGTYDEVVEKYGDMHVQGTVMTGTYYSPDYIEIYLQNIVVLNETKVCH